MVHNFEYKDPTLQVYEALAIAEEKNQEIEKLRREIEELRRNMQEFQGASNAEGSLPQGPANSEVQQNSNPPIPSFDVKQAIETITQTVFGLLNTVLDLAERVEEITHKEIKEVEEKIASIDKSVEGKIGSMRHSTTDLSNPQIVLLGGPNNNKNNISTDIFQLDYATKKWKILSIKIPYDVDHHGCVIVNDELYIIGGKAGIIARSSVQRLNKQLKWEKITDMNETRWGIQNSCVVYDNCIWVFGGARDENGKRVYLNTVEKYDPKTDQWEKKKEMNTKRGFCAAAVIKVKIYVCGGHNTTEYLDSVEVFDTTSEIWTDFCTMPEPRYSPCVIVEGTSIILIGGYFNVTSHKTVWKMDVEEKEKKWTDLPPLNQGRSHFSAVKIKGGHILVTGGNTFKADGSLDQTLNSVEIFDGQKWNEFSSLLEERWGHTTCLLTPSMVDAFNEFLD